MRQRGFTRAEVLVVVSVPLIAAAVLLATFARARENARRSSCQSNLKQIGLGFKQYCRDYDEKYPRRESPSKGMTGSKMHKLTHWAHALQPYLKSTSIFQCPSEFTTAGTDYYLNAHMSGRRDSEVVQPNVFVMLTEGADRSDCINAVATGAQKGGSYPAPFERHLDGSNYAFVDGHVKWLHSSKSPSPLDLNGGFTFRGILKPLVPPVMQRRNQRNIIGN